MEQTGRIDGDLKLGSIMTYGNKCKDFQSNLMTITCKQFDNITLILKKQYNQISVNSMKYLFTTIRQNNL